MTEGERSTDMINTTSSKQEADRPPMADDCEKMDKQIARTLNGQIKLICDCTLSDKPTPAEIKRLTFHSGRLELLIHWPFFMPRPTGDSGDCFPTARDVAQFRARLRQYILEHTGKKLSNLLFDEFITVLMRHMKLHRFDDRILKHLRPGERRQAGRPRRPAMNGKLKALIRQDGAAIYRTLCEWQGKIQGWQRRTPAITEKEICDRLRKAYDRDNYPWMRDFTRLTSVGFPRNSYADNNPAAPRLSEPKRWSTLQLTAVLVQERLYRETGIRHALNALTEVIRKGISPR